MANDFSSLDLSAFARDFAVGGGATPTFPTTNPAPVAGGTPSAPRRSWDLGGTVRDLLGFAQQGADVYATIKAAEEPERRLTPGNGGRDTATRASAQPGGADAAPWYRAPWVMPAALGVAGLLGLLFLFRKR